MERSTDRIDRFAMFNTVVLTFDGDHSFANVN
jgi:hypothetical protein